MTKGIRAAWISLISNIGLTVGKLFAGYSFRSPSLVADGIQNGADVLASAVSLGSMRFSKRPADHEHPYGHGKVEVIASGIVSIILFVAAIAMVMESIQAMFRPAVEPHGWALVVAIFSLIGKQVLYRYTIRIGKAEKSSGLIATAYDHLSDVYASLAVVIGIGLAFVGEQFQWTWTQWADPIAGLIISIIIIRLAYHMGRDAGDILIERNVSNDWLQQYIGVIESIPNVKRIDRIRAREHGHYILIDLRISVPGELTVREGHDIGREIKHQLMKRFDGIEEVLVHVNPWYESANSPYDGNSSI